MQELKRFVINLKSLDQDIPEPIIVGAGDANGRTLSVILTQEAAARMTPSTLLYLSWKHQDTKVEGLNVFTKVNDKPATWEIHYPQSLLREGNVLACLKFIDDISISVSTNFVIRVLSDPNEAIDFEDNDDYSVFKQAAMDLQSTNTRAIELLEEQNREFRKILDWFYQAQEDLRNIVTEQTGIIPEGYDTVIDYLDTSQEDQNITHTEMVDKAQAEAIEESKDYVDNALRIIPYE